MARLMNPEMNPEMNPDPLPTAWITLDFYDGTNVHIPEHHAEELLWRIKEHFDYKKREKESAERMAGKPRDPVPSPYTSYNGRQVYEHDVIEHPHLPGVPRGTVIRIPDPFFEIPERARWIVKYDERTEKALSVMCGERYKGKIVTD